MFDNAADVKCCFSIFCTIIICEWKRWCKTTMVSLHFSNKIYSAVVSCELLHVLFILLDILYIRLFPSFELLCEWNPMVWLFKWAIWSAIRTYIHANSPVLSGSLPDTTPISQSPSLPVSHTDHHMSRIKSSFELFCALVWDLAHF